MTFSNKLTIGRIIAVPVFIFFIALKGTVPLAIALIVFILAGLTDLYDGYLARKLGQVTKLGQFLDPIADKMIVTAALISLLSFRELGIPVWCIIVIISREFIINDLRDLAVLNGISIPVSKAGKIKTAIQMVGIITILCVVILRPLAANIKDGYLIINLIVLFIILIILFATLGTGLDYLLRGLKLLKEKNG